MSRVVLPTAVLKAMRAIGDPELERVKPAGGSIRATIRKDGLAAAAPSVAGPAAPIDLDLDKLFEAQRLFAAYPLEIAGALMLAALPQSYATTYGAGVLAASGVLEKDLSRRIARTAQFLLGITRVAKNPTEQQLLWAPPTPGGSGLDGVTPPWQLCVALRFNHHAIREDLNRNRAVIGALLGKHNDPPLNQEDLLGMLLTFSITVFEVLERFAITWSADDQEAYLYLWDVVGHYLGIGSPGVIDALESKLSADGRSAADPVNEDPDGRLGATWATNVRATWQGLRPPSIDDTRSLLEQIRARQWIDPTPDWNTNYSPQTSTRSGRILVRALLDELGAAMPRSLDQLPIAVMRALNPDVVRRRLNLGGNGVVLRALSQLPARRAQVGRFTAVEAPNPIGGRILRSLANEVTTRASIRFIGNRDYVFPGVGDWQPGTTPWRHPHGRKPRCGRCCSPTSRTAPACGNTIRRRWKTSCPPASR